MVKTYFKLSGIPFRGGGEQHVLENHIRATFFFVNTYKSNYVAKLSKSISKKKIYVVVYIKIIEISFSFIFGK